MQTGDPGKADCNTDGSDGCETDITTVNDCGSCGKHCNSTHATPGCTGGKCTIKCFPGFDDCDGDATTGCEAETGTDVFNCGTCGLKCGDNHASPKCVAAKCTLTCSAGWGDCNMDPADGCEVNTATDRTHCGSCSNACSVPGASAVCAAAPVVAWFGSWKRRAQVEQAMPHPIRCELIWAKDCHVGPPCPAAMRDERIWIFSRETFEGQHFETTVWDEPIIPTWEHRWHDNQKPERLMGRLIRWVAAPGARVIDPFMGSGSTLVAAQRLGFACVGIDASEEHCEAAVVRLGGTGKQAAEPVGPLFGGKP